MGRQPYYTLLAGLPPLPRFDRAERLPITKERLQIRSGMLATEDAALLEYASEFLAWKRQTATRTDEEMVASYKKLEEYISQPDLHSFFAFNMDQRTIMAGLRRRQRNLTAPSSGESWGVGRYVDHIQRNWDAPNFKLSAAYSWIPIARRHLEAGEALALERLLKNNLWDHIDRSVEPYDFGIRAVLSYFIKWDILDQWLSYNVEAAKKRFEELVAEVIDGQ
jgi:hypothetical protein